MTHFAGRWSVLAALISVLVWPVETVAQVVEEREQAASNPGKVIFHTTLYGAATGAVLGGAYALIEDDDDLDAWEILRWGVAGGAAAGLVVGLIYVVARPEPKGDVEDLDTDEDAESSSLIFAKPSVQFAHRRDPLGNTDRRVDVNLVAVRF
jgi:hypothetical protein